MYLENMNTSTLHNRITVRTMAQNTWRGMMQGEGMLDWISIVHWRSLPNTLILWKTSCTISSHEICSRPCHYYKCSLLVSKWRQNSSLTSQMEFIKLYLKPCEVPICNADFWTNMTDGAGPPYSKFKMMALLCQSLFIGEYGCLCKGSRSPLVHKLAVVQQWSTLPGMLK